MRRRQKEVRAVGGAKVPDWLNDFVVSDWPGISDFQRWEAWDAARREWAAANLPGGVDDIDSLCELIPDQPWSEAKLLL